MTAHPVHVIWETLGTPDPSTMTVGAKPVGPPTPDSAAVMIGGLRLAGAGPSCPSLPDCDVLGSGSGSDPTTTRTGWERFRQTTPALCH